MMQAYLEEGLEQEAVFDLFVRRLPPHRNYLVACGLDDVLRFLETLAFDDAAFAYLDSVGQFTHASSISCAASASPAMSLPCSRARRYSHSNR